MIRKIGLVGLALLLLVLAAPRVAEADSKVPLKCSLSLAVIDPGTMEIDGNKVKTTGEKTLGALDCNVDSMDGAFSTVHSSKITVNPRTGSFKGDLEGVFTLQTATATLTGKMTADIFGLVIGTAPSPPFPSGTLIHRVMDNGKWKINGGEDVKGKGVFSVTLTGIVGVPASQGGLSGGGLMIGVLGVDD